MRTPLTRAPHTPTSPFRPASRLPPLGKNSTTKRKKKKKKKRGKKANTKAKQRKAKESGFNLAPASQTGIPEYDAFGDMSLKRHFGRRGVVQQLLDTGLVERDEDDRDAIVVCDTPKAIFWSKPEHLQGEEEDVMERMERSRSARLAAKEALPKVRKSGKAGSRSPGSPGSEGMSKASKAARHKQHIAHAEEAARLTSFPPWADNAKSLDFTEVDSLTEADAAAARGRRMLAAREAEDAAVEDSRLTAPRNSPGSPGSSSWGGNGNGHGQGGEGHSGHSGKHLDHADAAAESFFKSNKDILEFDDNARQREELRKMKEEQAKDAAGRCAVCSGYCAFPSKRWNIS